MSTVPIEVAEEALEKKIEALKIVDENTEENKTTAESLKNSEKEALNSDKERRQRKPRLTDEELRQKWEEERKSKAVKETGVTGKVKWYSVLGHYGFISRDDGKPDVFVHQSAISKSPTLKVYLRTLGEKEDVVFDVVEGNKGLEASNLTGPNGEEVKGSRYQRILLYRNRHPRRSGQHRQRERDNEKTRVVTERGDGEGKEHNEKRKPRHRRQRLRNKKNSEGDIAGLGAESGHDEKLSPSEDKPKDRTHRKPRKPKQRQVRSGSDSADHEEKGGSRRRVGSHSSHTNTKGTPPSSGFVEDHPDLDELPSLGCSN